MNISEDQKQPKYVNTSFITRIISGETISIEEKGIITPLKPVATMLFSVNEVISFKEIGLHIRDRFVVIPFNNTFTDENGNRDIDIGSKLCKPLPLQIIATKSIYAFFNVVTRGKFTIPKIVETETKKYFMECNNVVEFADFLPIETFIGKAEYYKKYTDWCYDNFYEPLTNAQFGKQVIALGYRSERYSFEGKRSTYYANSTFKNDRCSGIYQDFLVAKAQTPTLEFDQYLWKQIDVEQKTDDEQTTSNNT